MRPSIVEEKRRFGNLTTGPVSHRAKGCHWNTVNNYLTLIFEVCCTSKLNSPDNTHFEDVELENIISIEKSSFKDIFEEYAGIRSSKSMYNMGIFRASRIEIEKPLVKEAYEILGADRVREMKYHQSNIKKEIIKRKHETADTKIFLLLDGQLRKQVAIPKSEIKQKLAEVYKELGLKQTAKATDLER